MVLIEEQSDYLSINDIGDGITAKIVDEGEYNEVDTKWGRKNIFSMNVMLSSGVGKTYSPNKISRDRMKDAWGGDTIAWVNREIKLNKVSMIIAGKLTDALAATPIKDEGKTPAQEKKVKATPKSAAKAVPKSTPQELMKQDGFNVINVTAQIIRYLNTNDEATFEQLQALTGADEVKLTTLLGRLMKNGELYQPRGGVYKKM